MSQNKKTVASLIRKIPDFPKPGILFYDISTVIQDAKGLSAAIDLLEDLVIDRNIDTLAAIESRGFIFAAALADRLNKGLILIRKKGKLPGKTESVSYSLEYGEGVLEMTSVAVSKKGQKILLVDDLLATGGTARAACELISRAGGQVTQALFLIELTFLGGSKELGTVPMASVIQYDN